MERNFAMQESKRMLVAFPDSCIAKICYAGIQVACRCVSGFASSKASLSWNPCGCSSHLWIPVLRSFGFTGIQKHHDRSPGFLHSEIALQRNPEARRKSTCAHVAAFYQNKHKTIASIAAHELNHEFAPLMFESC